MGRKKIIIYTDGSCRNNGQENTYGGWAAVVASSREVTRISGGAMQTTNNRMELTACIEGLRKAAKLYPKASYTVFSDSQYLVDCMNQRWYLRWIKNGWKTARKQSVINQDLWQKLIDFPHLRYVDFEKVKGHSGNALNNTADAMAQRESAILQLGIRKAEK